jgi:hypothetical protein
VGADRTFTAGSGTAPSAYRDAVAGTPGLRSYWRLGEASGTAAAEQKDGPAGQYRGQYRLGELGTLTGDRDTAAHFDGTSGEMSASGPALSGSATMEGWFNWGSGVAVARDDSSTGGWLLAFDSGGSLAYRLGGTSFNTGLSTGSVRNGWHHLLATKEGSVTAFYVDGQLVHSGAGAASATSRSVWHVMRNGATAQYSEGRADEVALYDRALSASEVQRRYELGRSDRNPPDTWILGGPSGTTANASPSFELSSDEEGSTFTCRLDGPGATVGTTAPCTSPKAFSKLAKGSYRLTVVARDNSGNADPTAATRSFSIAKQPSSARARETLSATGSAASPSATVPAVSSSAIEAALRGDLSAAARLLRRARVGRLLRRRVVRVGGLDVLVAGEVRIVVRRGRAVVLVGKRAFERAGRGSARLKLTRRGRALLAGRRRLRVTLKATFAAADGRRVSARRGVTLSR